MPKLKAIVLLLLLFLLVFMSRWVGANSSAPESAIVPGTIRTDPTYNHIGVRWSVSGDTDRDSNLTLEFREQGVATWQAGAVAMRAYPTTPVNGSPLNLNYWAASALFLQPGTTYELRLTLTDPDGGGDTQIVTETTRTWPQPATSGRDLYVVPGNGGGDGSPGNPFQGLQTAADAAQAGDTFHVAPGTYTPFELLVNGTANQPVTFMGPADATAVIDGSNTDRGVVTLGAFNQTLGHIILTEFTIQNGRWGIDAQHTHDIYIHHNIIQDVDYGVLNRRGDGAEFNQTVCDNVIHGRTAWPDSGIPGERGIDLRGTGNVVCYNEVRNFGDCVSVQPFTGASFGNDVFGNDAAYCVDDGIEVDYNESNVRVWRNRVMNARMGTSIQPVAGGPAYIFRNEFFNLESQPIKMNNQPSGFVVMHNTAVKHENGLGDPSETWRNALFRNNLFLGTRYAFEFTTVADEGFRDFDFNAWGTTRNPADPFFKWDNVRYDHITDLPSGVEDNGVEAAFSDLVNATLPAAWNVSADPGSRDLRLNGAVPEIDNGIPLANVNDAFTINGNPDMGAFEFGQPLPAYGPRAVMPDLSQSQKTAVPLTPAFNETVTYTITIHNTGTALNEPLTLTDTLPVQLTYNPGTLAASLGVVDDAGAPTLVWTGTPGDEAEITITYAATVNTNAAMLVTNTAVLRANTTGTLERSAMIIVNGLTTYLPLIFR